MNNPVSDYYQPLDKHSLKEDKWFIKLSKPKQADVLNKRREFLSLILKEKRK